MKRIDTETSVYLFDEAGRYLRMPKGERERETHEKLEQLISEWMDDNVWFPYVKVELDRHPLSLKGENDSLRILYPGAIRGLLTTSITDETLAVAQELVNGQGEP